MSVTENAGSTVTSGWQDALGRTSIVSLSVTDNALSTALATFHLSYKLQTGWNKDMVQISDVTIFKNWQLTIPAILNHFGITQ